MNMDHGHLVTVLVEVHVVGDQPRLVSLDELDQLVHGCLELLELSLSDLRSVDVDDQAEGGREGKARRILLGGLDIAAGQERLRVEREQRLAMQERLVEGTVGRVQEMGLVEPTYPTIASDQGNVQISKGPQGKELSKKSPIGDTAGEQFLPPKPSAVVDIPETLEGVQIPRSPDIKQWTEEDREAWNAMSPERKKDWVANRPKVCTDRRRLGRESSGPACIVTELAE
jgi:hypothetical protein